MLTRNQVTEEQAAILAACPRPRALAPLAASSASLPASFRSAFAAASVAAAPAGFGSVAAVRPSVDERPESGKGLWQREMTGLGFGTAAMVGAGAIASTIAQYPQDQHYLTSRREPRTWRPPA